MANPVDMLAAATARTVSERNFDRRRGPECRLRSSRSSSVPYLTSDEEVAAAIMAANARDAGGEAPIAVFIGSLQSQRGIARLGSQSYPAFPYPESAAIALAHAVRYGEWRARDHKEPIALPLICVEMMRRRSIIAARLARGASWLELDEVASVLSCYGIPMSPQRKVAGPNEAAAADAADAERAICAEGNCPRNHA